MPIPRKTLVALALLFGCTCSTANDNQVTWSLPDWAGFSNFHDQQPVDGLVYETLRLITEQLPEYQHGFRLGNVPRTFKDIAAGKPVCFGAALATAERDRIGYFAPMMVLPPVHLIVRPELATRLRPRVPLPLRELLNEPELRGVVTKGRLYGPALQALLHGQPPSNLQLVHTPNLGTNLSVMVAYKRADYTLEYPLPRLLHAAGPSQLTALPLEETGPFAISGVYCAKTPWGLRLIERFRQEVGKQARQPQALLAIYERWLPASQLPDFQPHIAAFLQHLAETPATPPSAQ
jgi:uncharacterized protein (TIGR02285 family)